MTLMDFVGIHLFPRVMPYQLTLSLQNLPRCIFSRTPSSHLLLYTYFFFPNYLKTISEFQWCKISSTSFVSRTYCYLVDLFILSSFCRVSFFVSFRCRFFFFLWSDKSLSFPSALMWLTHCSNSLPLYSGFQQACYMPFFPRKEKYSRNIIGHNGKLLLIHLNFCFLKLQFYFIFAHFSDFGSPLNITDKILLTLLVHLLS